MPAWQGDTQELIMTESLLVLNAGSSSIKYAIYGIAGTDLRMIVKGQIENIGDSAHYTAHYTADYDYDDIDLNICARNHHEALEYLVKRRESADVGTIVGVGHRVTHGGVSRKSLRIDEVVLDYLRKLTPLAPLHQPANLSGVDAVLQRYKLPSVACFDTAFHSTQSDLVKRFALPQWLFTKGVRRYGFHGLSYDYIAHYMASEMPRRHQGKVIVAHLGNGASLCAMEGGRSIETTMGFSALDGLCMGSRCGNIDPGVLLYLMESEHMDAQELEELLYRKSGLLGLSGISNDMRQLTESDEADADFAVAYFVHHLNREIGALMATMGGLDTLVFTGGIGENSRQVRASLVEQAQWLGLELDTDANEANATVISTPNSKVEVLVIPTDEELLIARHTLALLQGRPED
jgi:acetate kinase